MKKFRLFLMAILAIVSIGQVQARAVGDVFTVNNRTYKITSIEGGNLTVTVYDFKPAAVVNGVLTIPGSVADSTTTTFQVTSAYFYAKPTAEKNAVTKMTFEEGLKTLAPNSITSFSNLTTINLPASLEEYYPRAIYSNGNLTTFTVASGNQHFKASADGILYSYDGTILYNYPEGKTATSFSIPNGVTTIFGQRSITNHNLTSLTIPQTCTNISRNAIYGQKLTTLTLLGDNPAFSLVNRMLCNKAGDRLIYCPQGISGSLTLPATIKTLDTLCFYGCRQITALQLTGVETIKRAAFYLIGLGTGVTITLYPSLKNVEENLGQETRIKKFIISGTNNYFSVDANGVLYNKDYTRLIKYPSSCGLGNYTPHANTRIIEEAAIESADLISVTIPKNVEEIHASCFLFNRSLQSITFPEDSKLKSIGRMAFRYCTSLTTITLPASLDSIGDYRCFEHCDNLQTVYVKSGSQLSYLGENLFSLCPKLTTFAFSGTHIAPSLTIGDRAFANCPKLASANGGVFDIPKATTKIGESAFNGCSSIKQFAFANDAILDTIGFCAFQNTGLTAIDIPKSVRFIGNEAFNSCQQLKTVTIPAATTYVGPQAFLFCGQLREILVDKNNPNYSSVDGMFASKDKKTLYAFPAGKADTYYTMLSPSFETINDSAFYYMRNLRSVTIPKRVTRIGEHAFALCPNLERINFLANTPIDDVHAEAFIDMQRNSRLKDIDIYVRQGRRAAYEGSSFWGRDGSGSLKVKSIGESFVIEDAAAGQKAEYFPLSPTDASLIDVHSDVHTFVVPPSVTGGGRTYDVKLIGDYAFEDCTTDVEEVVVPGSVALNYVGARAFIKKDPARKPVRSIFIVGSTPSDLATSAFGLHDPGVTGSYDEAAAGQTIYVKKSAESAYKSAWHTLAGQIGYKIPGLALTKTYGTFAREFDVDLADYFAEYGAGKVYAFTSAPDQTIYEGRGDGSEPGTWYIRMRSVNEDLNGDGIYIPAYTGVLLKSMDGAATPAAGSANGAFYYTIGDSTTVNTNVSSVLVGVTVRSREVKDTNRDIYVMSGGVFKPLAGQTVSSFPVHKAYLQLPGSQYPGSGGAKIVFLFDGEPTEIDAFGMDGGLKMDGPVYDLQGRRVTAPRKGIYIKNGRKMVVK